MVLLGNKSDLESKRVIKPETAANFAVKNGYIFMETSCEKNKNVADAFTTLIEKTNIRMKKNEESNKKMKKNKKSKNSNNSKEKKEGENKIKINAKTNEVKKKKCPCWIF